MKMVLRLYNSMGRNVSPFRPIRGKVVGMYSCGPTVYNYAHIGNFRTFVFNDTLRRYLLFKGYRVKQVMNITDVEDRIIEGMKRTGKSLEELTKFYTDAFMQDLATLRVQRAEHYPKATATIPEIVAAVKSLVRKGYAYQADDGSVYYSIAKFPRYGRLSGIRTDQLKKGARTADDHYEKMGVNDFALWKAWDPGDGPVFWETALGKGRPGWHIECSVMSMKYLGKSFDIHTGAKDLKFPHHENEIAQSEALTGKRFVKYWVHAEFLNMGGEKMSKSLGNIVTLRDLLAKGWDPRAIRLFLVSAHYREEVSISDEALAQATSTLEKMDHLLERLGGAKGKRVGKKKRRSAAFAAECRKLLRDFEAAMDDDLNTAKALAALFGFHRRVNTLLDSSSLSSGDAGLALETLRRVDSVFAVIPHEQGEEAKKELPDPLAALVAEREAARKARDYARADQIRDELKRRGVLVEDTSEGPVWRKLSTVT